MKAGKKKTSGYDLNHFLYLIYSYLSLTVPMHDVNNMLLMRMIRIKRRMTGED
jgi:hypothetical protein